ncbi:MAG: hypothetical protein ACD_23C00951G0003 [uncultured bacterium]|nr:MAG: hypothetical protein ACD_23C00951G0003 [uncultured bacterium]
MFHAPKRAVDKRTPRAKIINPIDIFPRSLMPSSTGCQSVTPLRLRETPKMEEANTGSRQSVAMLRRLLKIQVPSENCNMATTNKSTTAGPSACSPKVISNNGRPMLPTLLNMVGGTSVFGSKPSSRASGQARMPEPITTTTPPMTKGTLSARLNVFPAKAMKISAGKKICMFNLLAISISGRCLRP